MATLTFKVNDEEARRLREAARRENMTLSEYLRSRIRAGIGEPQPVGRVKCRRTGASIFAPAPQRAPLTTESVRRMLSDFP